jgi:hypothetical protein
MWVPVWKRECRNKMLHASVNVFWKFPLRHKEYLGVTHVPVLPCHNRDTVVRVKEGPFFHARQTHCRP